MDTNQKHMKERSSKEGGFTFIELLVAISILLVLATAMLFNYNSMNVRLTLDTLAHQAAQWVRETQVLAMSVKQTSGGVNTFPGYGLHFERATPDQFVFFADFDGDKSYAPIPGGSACGDAGVECQKVIKLLKGNKITKLCMSGTVVSATLDCGPNYFASVLDVVFTRPDPDANINGTDSLGASIGVAMGRVTITAPSAYSRTVEIWTTGQVSVQ
jgi:prepilin-type N-terminal cleavage/methylation domain-containing protein